MLEAFVGLVVFAAGFVGGAAYVRRQGRQHAARHAEWVRRVEPSSRTPGYPTNRDAEPSHVRRPRWTR